MKKFSRRGFFALLAAAAVAAPPVAKPSGYQAVYGLNLVPGTCVRLERWSDE